ncbi:hypothetical protein EDD17DRAFT_208359 [Pisolithus thermaeus]|nr:hypothetical protein EDD17DRAFT_208359 [Pisolithus thermaeus]
MVYSNRGTRLALQQPKGISLPANEHFVLLLKALSTRLAGEHLVTTIIQCSDFYEVDGGGERKDLGDDSAPASSNQFQGAGIATPLFTIATPQVWTREWPCEQRRERFKSIRKRFYALVNMHQPPESAPNRKPTSRQKKIRTINSFSNMFGLHCLRNYIGKITFFVRFFQMIEPDPSGDVLPVGAVKDGLPDSCQQADGAQSDPRLEVVLPLLHKRYQTLRAVGNVPPQLADDRQKVEYELRSISQTLGANLLHHIMITFENACYQCFPWPRSRQASHMYYDRQLNTSSMIQEIQALQLKLNATKDEDERRALEEDVTGKILWLFWCGICAEVDELLPKVMDYVRREENLIGSSDMWRSATCTEPEDYQAHLRRITFDAGAGTSKHQLLLAARAAEQAKWSGTTRQTSTIDT